LEPPLHHQPQPGVIAETLHSSANAHLPHDIDNFINFSTDQDAQSLPPRQVHRANGPLRRAHQNK
jgi:hypothetical protein